MKKILVVADHPDVQELLVWQLELMGFSAVAASDAQAGVTKAQQEKPEMILIDAMLPGVGEREAARALRSSSETQAIPILATTALFRESDLRSCIEAGCDDYIMKPYTFEELQEKLHGLIVPPTTNQG